VALQCTQTSDCEQPVATIDDKGWLYCDPHGHRQRPWRRLNAADIARLEAGKTISFDTPTEAP